MRQGRRGVVVPYPTLLLRNSHVFRGYLPGKGGRGGGEGTRDVKHGVPECGAWVVDVRSGPSNEIYGGKYMADNAEIVKSRF